MISINNKQYRNLEEQVGFLTEAYDANRVVAEFGINVMGTLPSQEDLPANYDGNYGDAFAVGLEPPYDFYIWTRPNPSVGQDEAYWFYIGELAIVGPQGLQGPQGEKGDPGIRGSQWFSGSGAPVTTSGYNVGDYYINVNTGNIWHLHNVGGIIKWLLEGNITGPQGPQGIQGVAGPQGPQGVQGDRGLPGPAGPMIQILGEITSVDQLPDPDTVDRNAAYVIPSGDAFEVYAIVGPEGSLEWMNLGYIGSTLISDNGTYISEFDVSTKVDKTSQGRKIYGTDVYGNQKLFTVGQTALMNTTEVYDIPQRRSNGAILVPDPDWGTSNDTENTKGQYAANIRTVKSLIAESTINLDINSIKMGAGVNNHENGIIGGIVGGTTDTDYVRDVVEDVFGPISDWVANSITLHPSRVTADFGIAIGADNVSSSEGAITLGYKNNGSGWGAMSIGADNTASGAVSYARGYKNNANGNFSTAVGTENTVTKDSAGAFGNKCQATGKRAFAFGNECKATADYAFAEGGDSTASGVKSHAEGNNTTASNIGAHSEGKKTTASGEAGHAEGVETKATGYASHAEGEKSTAGNYAHAEGYNTKANGSHAHSEGSTTIASGTSAHAEGWYTQATDEAAHSEGAATVASAFGAHAEGGPEDYVENVDGTYTITGPTTASAYYAHAEGRHTTASAQAAHAEGYKTVASGQVAHAEGYNTLAVNTSAHAEGTREVETINIGGVLHDTGAHGEASHSEGWNTCAISNSSHAEGNQTVASGASAHAEGGATVASGGYSHAEGLITESSGDYSHAEGYNTLSSGVNSHAEGENTKAKHKNSHAGGLGTETGRVNQTVVGEYNTPVSTALFIVGNGGEKSPSNAFVVLEDGRAFLGDEQVLTKTEWNELTVGESGTATLNVTKTADYEFYIDFLYEGLNYRVMLGNLHLQSTDTNVTIRGNVSAPIGPNTLYLQYHAGTKQISTKAFVAGQEPTTLFGYTLNYRIIHE